MTDLEGAVERVKARIHKHTDESQPNIVVGDLRTILDALASITRERDEAVARAERLSLTLGVYKTAEGLRKCLETNRYPDPALVEKVNACLAVLGHATLSAALVNGEGGE